MISNRAIAARIWARSSTRRYWVNRSYTTPTNFVAEPPKFAETAFEEIVDRVESCPVLPFQLPALRRSHVREGRPAPFAYWPTSGSRNENPFRAAGTARSRIQFSKVSKVSGVVIVDEISVILVGMAEKRRTGRTRPAPPRRYTQDAPREWPEWILRLCQRLQEETPGKREWAERAGPFILQLMDLSEASLVDAAAAPDNWHAMLRAMGSPELLEHMQASDPLARAFLDGLDARARLIEQNGGVFKTEQVAEYLGISPQAVNKRRSSRQLLGLTFRRRGHVFPAWQFDQYGTLAGLEQALLALAKHDEWMQNVFFVTPNTRLGGRRPIELLRDKKVAEVVEAARDFGEHGAA